jgi:hypothetical protein
MVLPPELLLFPGLFHRAAGEFLPKWKKKRAGRFF